MSTWSQSTVQKASVLPRALMLWSSPLCSFRKSQAWVFVPESLGAQSVGGEYEPLPLFSASAAAHWSEGNLVDVCLFPQFNFFNCFASLFYIAFVMQDMVLLRQVGQATCWGRSRSTLFFLFAVFFFVFAALLNCLFCSFLMMRTVVWGHAIHFY